MINLPFVRSLHAKDETSNADKEEETHVFVFERKSRGLASRCLIPSGSRVANVRVASGSSGGKVLVRLGSPVASFSCPVEVGRAGRSRQASGDLRCDGTAASHVPVVGTAKFGRCASTNFSGRSTKSLFSCSSLIALHLIGVAVAVSE